MDQDRWFAAPGRYRQTVGRGTVAVLQLNLRKKGKGFGASVCTPSHLTTFELRLLIYRLDEYVEDPTLTSATSQVVQVPPPMTFVACKPLFFDLALNHVDFPSLDDKIETKKTGAGMAGI